MQTRREIIPIQGIPKKLRILHISDVHFSRATGHRNNAEISRKLLALCDQFGAADAVCVTGDLVSRKYTPESFQDASALLRELRTRGRRLYFSLGNHEMDYPQEVRQAFLDSVPGTVLDNAADLCEGVWFAGLTLPQTVYKNPKGGYRGLSDITCGMVEGLLGTCPGTPCVLLAHSPMGLHAYAQWGADAVLSGHVHGGIVRLGKTGFLSPERRFFPRYTKGLYREGNCTMNVSAGVGKFRMMNPAEVVCIEIVPEEEL